MEATLKIDTTQDGSASGASTAPAAENSTAGGAANETSSGLETSGAGGAAEVSGIE